MPPAGRVVDLGQRKRGEIVEVTLRGSAANVLLVDSTNKRNYEAGRRMRYVGGLVKRSPYRMAVPSSGHSYVLVTLDGLRGMVSASVRVLRDLRGVRVDLDALHRLRPDLRVLQRGANCLRTPDDRLALEILQRLERDVQEVARWIVWSKGQRGLPHAPRHIPSRHFTALEWWPPVH